MIAPPFRGKINGGSYFRRPWLSTLLFLGVIFLFIDLQPSVSECAGSLRREMYSERIAITNDSSLCMYHHDPRSPKLVRNEVDYILHHPGERKIVIHLKKSERECRNPRFLGRLSGPYVSLIEWEHQIYQNRSQTIIQNKTSITGIYDLPFGGKYFIEIIGLLCNDLNRDTDFNDISLCLEDPSCNRLTANGSYITVPPETSSLQKKKPQEGYWQWVGDGDPVPLYTRHQGQPDICKLDDVKMNSCRKAASLDRFTHYQFKWQIPSEQWQLNNYYENEFMSPVDKQNINQTTICLIGMSHSKIMKDQMRVLLLEHNMSNAVKVEHFFLERPRHMTKTLGGRIKSICNVTLVASGQWAAAGARLINIETGGAVLDIDSINYTTVKPRIFWGNATLFCAYEHELESAIRVLKENNVSFAFRQIHYNTLGYTKTWCKKDKIQDHRWPPIIDGYNDIIKKIATQHSIPFFDSRGIVDPLWDSAPDTNHYDNDVGMTESLWFLRKMLDFSTSKR